jgi:shikimate kinase
MRKDIVYLTGFMGSGKSTIGPILANTIGYDFRDVDKTIETTANKTVMEIFANNGEGYFRELERRIIQEISNTHGCVVSLGGGTVTKSDNLSVIKTSGVLIYLKADPEEIFHRLKYKADRPLLKGNEGRRLENGELLQRIARLMEEREAFYAHADIVVSTAGKRIGQTVDEIVRRIRPIIE